MLSYHAEQLQHFGGQAGVGNPSLLDSALAQPQNTWLYHPTADLFDVAAAYAFHIAKNHPFNDGNKRTALQACLGFLAGNKVELTVAGDKLYQAMIGVTTSEFTKPEFAAFLRAHSRSLEG
ncbi:MAG: death-on-curing protein [Verrucomicrobiales bacterium]|nr:death-on-curing protein [Verrucomicrobiales bacterium]